MNETKKKVHELLTEAELQDLKDEIIKANGGATMSEHVKKFCEDKQSGKGNNGLGGRSLDNDKNEKPANVPGALGGKIL